MTVQTILANLATQIAPDHELAEFLGVVNDRVYKLMAAHNLVNVVPVADLQSVIATKLSGRWDCETTPKYEWYEECIAAATQEFTADLDQALLRDLRAISERTPHPTWEHDDDLSSFVEVILDQAATIDANFMVVSPTSLTIMQSSDCGRFVRERNISHYASTKLCGKLGNMDVYCDQYGSDKTPVLIGRKGVGADAVANWKVFLPVAFDRKLIDPSTLEVVASFHTLSKFEYMPNAADYLRCVDLNIMSLGYA